MQAFRRLRYGAPATLELREVPIPDMTADQIRVRVHAAGVNALDWHVVRGRPYLVRLSDGLTRPRDPACGVDAAGTVEAVGANVTTVGPGDRVMGCRLGAFAEVVCGKNFVPIPDGVGFDRAAVVPTAGLTALQGLRDHGKVGAGSRVLINGAGAGSVPPLCNWPSRSARR